MNDNGTSPRGQQFRGISNDSAQQLLQQRVREAYQKQTAGPPPQPAKTQARSLALKPTQTARNVMRGMRGMRERLV